MTEQTPAHGFQIAPVQQSALFQIEEGGANPSAETPCVTEPEHRLRLHHPGLDEETTSRPSVGETSETPPTESEKLSADIVNRVLKAAHRLRSVLSGHFAEFDLSDVRFAVLRFLHDSEPAGCTQSELAQRLDQSESSISTLVKRMRDSGLLYRLRSTIDKRKWALKLTESGRTHFESAQTCHEKRMGELLDGFFEAELQLLAQLLDKLVIELGELSHGEKAEPKGEAAASSSDPTTHPLPSTNIPAA